MKQSKDRPYILVVAEKIYDEIVEIKKNSASGRDLSDHFTFDDGQRPGYYGPSRIVRTNSSSVS